MCPYNTYDEVIRICGLGTDATEAILKKFITEADTAVIEKITIKVLDEVFDDSIDGDNHEFWVENIPIADITATSLIQGYDGDEEGDITSDNADYHVYTWSDSEDEDTKTEVKVDNTKCNELTGRIYLETAPDPDTVEKITIDYSYYPNRIDFEQLAYCAALYTGYKFLLSKYSLMPRKVSLGTLKLDFTARGASRYAAGVPGYPYEKLRDEFNKEWMLIYKKPFRKVKGIPKEEPVAKLLEDIVTESE